MLAPGPLLASGRDADIFEYGPHQVLRRARTDRSQLIEAQTMEYLRSKGYPVPEVIEIDATGRDLVMERIAGPTMVDSMARAPWTLRRRAQELADLHRQLHSIDPPAFLGPAPVGSGEALVHLDLHPLNVLIAPQGPVVIDWTGASRGDADVDVVIAWILMSTGEIPGGRLMASLLGTARQLLVRSFVSCFDLPALSSRLEEVVAWKATDANMSSQEVASMWSLVRRHDTRG